MLNKLLILCLLFCFTANTPLFALRGFKRPPPCNGIPKGCCYPEKCCNPCCNPHAPPPQDCCCPSAPIRGTNCGLNFVTMAIPFFLVAGLTAIILSAGH